MEIHYNAYVRVNYKTNCDQKQMLLTAIASLITVTYLFVN